jgi:hypothetical protein
MAERPVALPPDPAQIMPIDPSLFLAQAEQLIVEEKAALEEQYDLLDEMTRSELPTYWQERLVSVMENTLSSYQHHLQIIQGWISYF